MSNSRCSRTFDSTRSPSIRSSFYRSPDVRGFFRPSIRDKIDGESRNYRLSISSDVSASINALKFENSSMMERIRALDAELLDRNSVLSDNVDFVKKLDAKEQEFSRIRERYTNLNDRVVKFMDKTNADRDHLESENASKNQQLILFRNEKDNLQTEVARLNSEISVAQNELCKMKRIHKDCVDRPVHDRVVNDLSAENERLRLAINESIPKVVHSRFMLQFENLVTRSCKSSELKRNIINLRGEFQSLKTGLQDESTAILQSFATNLHYVKALHIRETNHLSTSIVQFLTSLDIDEVVIPSVVNPKETLSVLKHTVLQLVARLNQERQTTAILQSTVAFLERELVSLKQNLNRHSVTRKSDDFVLNQLRQSVTSAERTLQDGRMEDDIRLSQSRLIK